MTGSIGRGPAASTPEIDLVIACSRPNIDADRAARIRALVGRELDWDAVGRVAAAHRVHPLVYAALDRVTPEKVPATVLAGFADLFYAGAARNLRLTTQLLEVLALLSDAGIDAVPLKGPVLAASVYGSLAFRTYNDLDVLVRRADIPRVCDLLTPHGYQLPRQYRRALAGIHPPSEYHAVFFPRDEGRVIVEIHAELLMWYFSVCWETRELLERTVSTEFAGTTIRTLSPEDTMLFLVSHATTHAWSHLEYVCSIAELIERGPALDWNMLAARARRLGALRMLLVGVRLASVLLDVAVPPPLVRLTDSDPGARRLAARLRAQMFADRGPVRRSVGRLATHVRARERLRDRARYCIRIVVNEAVSLSTRIAPFASD